MTRLAHFSPFFLIALMGIFSCVNDSAASEDSSEMENIEPLPANISEMIIGKWELTEGYRGGEKTETLADTYFSFTPDGKLQTNLGGGNEIVNFNIEGRTIKQDSQNFPVDYSIDEIGDSNMTISMVMRDVPFRFVLQKAIPEEGESEAAQ